MSSKKFIIILILVASASALFWGLKYQTPASNNDAQGYDLTVRAILEEGLFNDEPVMESGIDRPIYPVFLAVIYKIFGYHPQTARYWQMFLFVLISLLVYFLARQVFNERTGRLAGLITALCYSIASFTGQLIREVFFAFLIIALIYLLYQAQSKYKNIWFILSGIVAGLAFLTNTIIQFFIVFIMINFFILFWQKGFKKIYPRAAVFFIAFSLTIASWVVTDYLRFNQLPFGGGSLSLGERAEKMEKIEGKYWQHFIGNTLGDFFAQKWFPDYDRREARHGWDVWQRYNDWIAKGGSRKVINQAISQEAKEKILAHPWQYLKMTSIDFLKYNTPMLPDVRIQHMFAETHPELSDFAKGAIILFIRFCYLIFFILIIYTLVKNIKNWPKASWIILTIIYFNLIYSLIHAIARYSVPIYPYYIILASAGFLTFWDRIKKIILKTKSS